MTTTTIEQFREQCAKTIELFDDATMRESDYMLDAHECADIIRALPLPAMPEQAEPDDYQKFIDSLTDDDEDKMHMQIDAWARLSFARHNNSVRGQQVTISDSKDAHIIWATLRWAEENKKPDAALLARIAALEAENQKLKEDAAWLPIEQCLIGKPAIVKVNGIVQHIIVMLNNEGDWDCLDDGPYLDDFHPSHFKYLPEDDKA